MNFVSFADDNGKTVLINPAHIVGLEADGAQTVVFLSTHSEILANLDLDTILGLLEDV
jgi:hypothetical protein